MAGSEKAGLESIGPFHSRESKLKKRLSQQAADDARGVKKKKVKPVPKDYKMLSATDRPSATRAWPPGSVSDKKSRYEK